MHLVNLNTICIQCLTWTNRVPKTFKTWFCCYISEITPELLFADGYTIGRMNVDGSMVNSSYLDNDARRFDIDTVDNMIYYYDVHADDRNIKRFPINQTDESENIYAQGIGVFHMAVDWIGRYNCFYSFFSYNIAH